MRILFIGDKEKEAAQRLKEYAEENPFSLKMLKEIVAGTRKPAGDSPDYVCYLTEGYRVVFTVEEHPGGWMKHISISVDNVKRVPNTPALELIMKEFGMTRPLTESHTYMEENVDVPGTGPVNAVCVIQPR